MMPLYRFGAIIFTVICKLCRVKISGREHIPAGEVPVVVVGNHSSYADPILLGYALLPRQTFFIAKKEFESAFFVGRMMRMLGVIFVNRQAADLSAIKKSVAALRENKMVAIFAEGKRYHGEGLTDFKQGPVFIAYKGEAALLPVGIRNPQNLFKFWRHDAEVIIGEPIIIDKSEGKLHELMESYTLWLKTEIAQLSAKVE